MFSLKIWFLVPISRGANARFVSPLQTPMALSQRGRQKGPRIQLQGGSESDEHTPSKSE